MIFKAAGAAGIKPQALRSRTSVTRWRPRYRLKAALANANIQITVLGATDLVAHQRARRRSVAVATR